MKTYAIFAAAAIVFLLLGCIGSQPQAQQPAPAPVQNQQPATVPIVPPPSPAVNNSLVPPTEPANNSTPPAPPAPNVTQPPAAPSGEGASCGGAAGIQCQPGLQCITSGQPDATGTCNVPAPATQELQTCPSQRNDNCPTENNPVCGRLVGGSGEVEGYRDYPGPCAACSPSSNAIGYYYGTCSSKNLGG